MTMKTLLGALIGVLGFGALALGCGDDDPAAQGAVGPKGDDGSSCSVEMSAKGTEIVCEDGTRALIATPERGPEGAKALLVQRSAAGDECAAGGTHIDYGSDSDRDGMLSSEETSGSLNVCNGAGGRDGDKGSDGDEGRDGDKGRDGANGRDGLSSLLAISDEPQGSNCSGGGKRVDYGIDDDRDGSLDANEIDGTSYLCGPACGLKDSSFQTTSAWVASGGATVEAAMAGDQDLGQGALVVSGSMGAAALVQMFDCSPTLTRPAVTMAGKYSTSGSVHPSSARFSVVVNGTALEANVQDALSSGPANTFKPLTFCLGETLAGQTLSEVQLNAEENSLGPGQEVAFRVDHVELESVAANECPSPGTIANGNFEAGDTGWAANGTLQIEDDGSGQNRALHMEFAPGCVGPTGNIMSGRISVPSAAVVAKPAVRLRIRGDASGASQSFSGRIEYAGTAMNFATWPAPLPAAFTTQTHCLPAASRGHSGRIVFALPINCGDGFRDLWVDDITIVDEPSCP